MKSIRINKGVEGINIELLFKADTESLANIKAFSTINSINPFEKVNTMSFFYGYFDRVFIRSHEFDREYS